MRNFFANIWRFAALIGLCFCFWPLPGMTYDGPVGVTFRAPAIDQKAMPFVRLKAVKIETKIMLDESWSMAKDGKGRAFPDGFFATLAESRMEYQLQNQSRETIKAVLLFPYDAAKTPGTGFTEPLE